VKLIYLPSLGIGLKLRPETLKRFFLGLSYMRKPKDMLFKQTDVERLLRAHQAMGVSVTIEVTPNGSLRALPLKAMATEASANPWDKADGAPAPKVRSRL
jgi:hypothetical protein